jgi:hypothetical protein
MILNLGKIFGCYHLEFAMVLDMREDGHWSFLSYQHNLLKYILK